MEVFVSTVLTQNYFLFICHSVTARIMRTVFPHLHEKISNAKQSGHETESLSLCFAASYNFLTGRNIHKGIQSNASRNHVHALAIYDRN